VHEQQSSSLATPARVLVVRSDHAVDVRRGFPHLPRTAAAWVIDGVGDRGGSWPHARSPRRALVPIGVSGSGSPTKRTASPLSGCSTGRFGGCSRRGP
jgi:hypothetical protein